MTAEELPHPIAGVPVLDLLGGYRWALRHRRGFGKRPPAVRFANALTPESQLAFARDFGPVEIQGENFFFRGEEPDGCLEYLWNESTTELVALEHREKVAREQRSLAAAARLVIELQSRRRTRRPDLLEIAKAVTILRLHLRVEGVALNLRLLAHPVTNRAYFGSGSILNEPPEKRHERMEAEWAKVLAAAERFAGRPENAEQVIATGHRVLCAALNAFPDRLVAYSDRKGWQVAEVASVAPTGARRFLFAWLREAYVAGMHGSRMLERCPECGDFFAVEHGRQFFCTERCERIKRQRTYRNRKKRAPQSRGARARRRVK